MEGCLETFDFVVGTNLCARDVTIARHVEAVGEDAMGPLSRLSNATLLGKAVFGPILCDVRVRYFGSDVDRQIETYLMRTLIVQC